MTVTRRVEVVYEAPDKATAERLERDLEYVVYTLYRNKRVIGQAMSAEPVIPSPEPLVESP